MEMSVFSSHFKREKEERTVAFVLLEPKRFDWIEAGSFPRRPQAKRKAQANRDNKSGHRRPERDVGRHEELNEQGNNAPDDDSQHSAQPGESGCLD